MKQLLSGSGRWNRARLAQDSLHMISQLLEESPPNGARIRAGELEHQAAVAPGDSKEAHSP
jgi:hypothetical protein